MSGTPCYSFSKDTSLTFISLSVNESKETAEYKFRYNCHYGHDYDIHDAIKYLNDIAECMTIQCTISDLTFIKADRVFEQMGSKEIIIKVLKEDDTPWTHIHKLVMQQVVSHYQRTTTEQPTDKPLITGLNVENNLLTIQITYPLLHHIYFNIFNCNYPIINLTLDKHTMRVSFRMLSQCRDYNEFITNIYKVIEDIKPINNN